LQRRSRSTSGTAYHYSNIGFDTLGLIVSRISGKPLGEVFRKRISRPLNLMRRRAPQ
jgi:D-alanyl-D-alanine carboxypeptidase